MFTRNDKNMAEALGFFFLLLMLLGFTPNPLLSPTGYFLSHGGHNMFLGISGLVLLACSWRGYGRKALMGVGILYIALAVAGYAGKAVSGMNMNDHHLHIVLGAILLAAGLYVRPMALSRR